jgi:hypothetical protein
MFLSSRTLLVVILIAASLVAKSAAKSAWALPNLELRNLSEAEQRREFNRILVEVFSEARVMHGHRSVPIPRTDINRMQAIAWCESRGRPHVEPDGELMRNRTGSFVGFLQVAHRVHQPEIQRLLYEEGRDVLGDVREYVHFTLFLYLADRRAGGDGFRPWPACRERTQVRRSPRLEVAEAQ